MPAGAQRPQQRCKCRLLLVPRLRRHRRLSEQREALQLAVAVKAVSLASSFGPALRRISPISASPSTARKKGD